jgi:hypothetical protein
MRKPLEMWWTVVRPRFRGGRWVYGERMAPDDEHDHRRRDFARRRRLNDEEGRGVESGATGMGG